MREIKFRAWDSEKMIYQNNMQSISWPNHLKKECAVWVRCDFNNMGYFELMQYTGIKDKHGKEIYEGDIIIWNPDGRKVESGKPKQVIWEGIGWDPFKGDMVDSWKSCRYEVVGNIYENQELLK